MIIARGLQNSPYLAIVCKLYAHTVTWIRGVQFSTGVIQRYRDKLVKSEQREMPLLSATCPEGHIIEGLGALIGYVIDGIPVSVPVDVIDAKDQLVLHG